MRAAAAEVAIQRSADMLIRRMGMAPEQRRSGHDHAWTTIATLRRLLLDERLLYRMWLIARAEASRVVICEPATSATGSMHDYRSAPRKTMHAPHCSSPQPKSGPLSSIRCVARRAKGCRASPETCGAVHGNQLIGHGGSCGDTVSSTLIKIWEHFGWSSTISNVRQAQQRWSAADHFKAPL